MNKFIYTAKLGYNILPRRMRSRLTKSVAAIIAPQPLKQLPRPEITTEDPRVVVAQLSSPYSIGRLARSSAAAMMREKRFATYGFNLSPYLPQGSDKVTQSHNLVSVPTNIAAKRRQHLFFLNGDLLPFGMCWLPRRDLITSYVSAVWNWELSRVPTTWRPGAERVDEIIVLSKFVAEAVSETFPQKKVRVVPPILKGLQPPLANHDSMLNDRLVILSSCNLGSDATRKNPIAVVRAFCDAFPPNSGPILRLHANSPQEAPELVQRMTEIAHGRADINLSFGTLPTESYNKWWQGGHLFCSLFRSEGYGMGLAEAMISGYAAIATGYSSVLDFMTTKNSVLVDYKLVPVQNSQLASKIDRPAQWADPSHDHAVDWLRRLNSDRVLLLSLAKAGKIDCQQLIDDRRFVNDLLNGQ